MKKFIQVSAIFASLMLVLSCFVSCKDEDKGGSSLKINVASLPKNVGDNPMEGVTLYDSSTDYSSETKIEFNANGTATFIDLDYNEKKWALKYSWDTTKQEIYLALTGVYVGDKSYSDSDSYFNALWNKKYEELKKTYPLYSDKEFEQKFQEKWDVSLNEYKQSAKEEVEISFNRMASAKSLKYKYSGNVFTEVFEGYSPLLMGDVVANKYIGNWEIDLFDIDYQDPSKDEEIDYDLFAIDTSKKTITYQIVKKDRELAKSLGVTNITINATYTEDVDKKTITINFKDPYNNNKDISGTITYEPYVLYKR